MSELPQRVADGIVAYSKPIIVVMLVATLFMGVGVPMVDSESDTEQFESDSPAVEASEYIEANFVVDEADNTTIMQIIQRTEPGENALSKESLIGSLELQKAIVESESVQPTLAREEPTFGVANLIASVAMEQQAQEQSAQHSEDGTASSDDGTAASTAEEQDDQLPTLDDHIATLEAQIAVLEALEPEELSNIISATLGPDAGPGVLSLLPESYEPGSPEAEAQAIIVTQSFEGEEFQGPEGFDQAITDAQLEIRDIALAQDLQYSVFGFGIITDEIDRSLGDSFAIVGPLALLFVVLALGIAYRDVLDILLGVVGIIAVLIWTFGFMGWTGIAFNQMLISVPVLLIGLSIDYAIHVFMRHRERRAEEGSARDLRRSMALALGGVGVALVWVTATAAIGFLANLTSPIGPLQDFGVTAAFGVVAALLIFGMLVPALKIELDGVLEGFGLDRQKRAFGTGGSYFSSVLATGSIAAKKFPLVIVVLALVLTLAGAYGATQVDTSFQEEDFLADDPPGWTEHLGPFAPGTYQAKADLEFIQANFQPEGSQADMLIRGEVTDDQVLRWMHDSRDVFADKESVFMLPGDQPDIRTPLSVLQETVVAIEEGEELPDEEDVEGTDEKDSRDTPDNGENDGTVEEDGGDNPGNQVTPQEFVEAYYASLGEDGIPQENIDELFDMLLSVNPAAAEVVYQNEAGEIEALRIVVEIRGDADLNEAADDLRTAAQEIAELSGGQLDVEPTGDQVIFDEIESDLLDTVIDGLLITLVAVFAFMALAYRATGNPASLGVVTLLPVVFAVAWILGSMWILDIPFNILTGTITSLTIGLGIAYSIHISARYELELRRQGNVWDAMYTAVTGTGGALLGSAATTIGAFGTLALAILPVLQQFGIITGLTILYAFLASVLVLPSLLILWTRYLGPSGYFPTDSEDEDQTPEAEGVEQPTADGGRETDGQ